jgi:hypothetical protein
MFYFRKMADIVLLYSQTVTKPENDRTCTAHAPQVCRAVDLFDQGNWEDLWKRTLKAGERAKARAA